MDSETLNEQIRTVVYECMNRIDANGIGSLNETHRLLYLGWEYVGQVLNGGHAQFFYNSSGAYASETVQALKELALPIHASALEAAAHLLFRDNPIPNDIKARNDVMCVESSDAEDHELEKLDETIFALDTDVVYAKLRSLYLSYRGDA